MSAYSPLKALRHMDIISGVRDGKPVRPAHVQLILSNVCNQGCRFCAYRMPGYTSNQRFEARDMMPTDRAMEIVDDCAEIGVGGIQFTGGGEPTAHPEFAAVLDRACRAGMATSVVTNGVMLARKQLTRTVAAACSWVRVSLDAGTPDTYERTRRCPSWHWQAAIKSVEALRRDRDHLAVQDRCVIGVGFVVSPDNWREVYDAARLARSMGADNIRISAMFGPDDEQPFKPFHEECVDLCKRAEELSGPGFDVINRYGARIGDLVAKRPDYGRCGYQHFTTYVGADLNVYRCCAYAYNERGLVGSLRDVRFRDLWMSQERADGMRAFDARGCERCQFNGINTMLDYALDQEPRVHEAFV